MTRKKVLSLPEKLPTVLCQNTCNEVTKVWVYFKSIYEEINTWSHDQLILFGTKQETGYNLFFLSEIREVGMKRNE